MVELYTPVTWSSIHPAISTTAVQPTSNIYVPSVITPSYRQQYIQENYPTTSVIGAPQPSPLLESGYQQAAGFEMNPAFRYIASGTSWIAGTIRQGIPEVSSRLATVPYIGVLLAYGTRFTSESVAGIIESAGMIPGGREILYKRPEIIPTAVRYGVGETLRPFQEEMALNRAERQESFENIAQTFADIGVSALIFKGIGTLPKIPKMRIGLRAKPIYPEGFMGEAPKIYKPPTAFEEAFSPMRRIDVWGTRAKVLRDFPLAFKPGEAFTQAFTSKLRTFPETEPGYVWKRPTETLVSKRGTFYEVQPEYVRGRTTFPELEPGYRWERAPTTYKPPPSYFKEPKALGISAEYYSELGQEVYKTFGKYRPKGTFIKEAGLGDIPSYFMGKKLSPEEIRAQRVKYGREPFIKGRTVSLKEMLMVTPEQKLIPLGRQLRQGITTGRSELYKAMSRKVPEVAKTVKRALPRRYTIESYLKQQARITKGYQESLQRGRGKSMFAERPTLKSRQRFLRGLIPVMRFRTETGLRIGEISGVSSKQALREAQTSMQRLDTVQITRQEQRERFITIPRFTFTAPRIIKPIDISKPRPPPKKPPYEPPTTKPPTFRFRKPRMPKPSRGLPESDYGRKGGLLGFGRFGELARIKSAKEMLKGI